MHDDMLWANDSGEDEFGFWVKFSITDPQGHRVTQTLRLIEPGTFLMGSPENEPGRFHDEGPQHQVTFRRSFWLFDTACTQALWQAVMGNNPSVFRGATRPVENVGWNDCLEFVSRINLRLPGINLGLPSEAQWEYACRAGTTTPFSFGANITPEQVNYDAFFSYEKKGLYRGETVPVASLPANPWGLYEMHGNVWEWTHDHWHDNYQDAPTDGSAWEDIDGRDRKVMMEDCKNTGLSWNDVFDTGTGRVIRGGSWNEGPRKVRTACRLEFEPEGRYVSLGFRLVRRHPSWQSLWGGYERSPADRRDKKASENIISTVD